jgi:hypothetical protein
MQPSIFATLCDVVDEFDCYVRDLESGPQRDKLEDLVRRLDAVIDRTVGVTEVLDDHPGEDERA